MTPNPPLTPLERIAVNLSTAYHYAAQADEEGPTTDYQVALTSIAYALIAQTQLQAYESFGANMYRDYFGNDA